MAVLGLRFCARAFSSCGKWGPLLIAARGPLTIAALSLSRPLLLRSTGSRCAGSVIVAHGPSCSAACGIFPDQGSNPCPLHWEADSQPLRQQGSPQKIFLSTCRKSKCHMGSVIKCSLGFLMFYKYIYATDRNLIGKIYKELIKCLKLPPDLPQTSIYVYIYLQILCKQISHTKEKLLNLIYKKVNRN